MIIYIFIYYKYKNMFNIILVIIIFIYAIFNVVNIILQKKNVEKFDNNNINMNNLFTYCINNTEENNVYYYIQKKNIGNALMTLAITNNNKILSYSNEYLSLIKTYYPSDVYNKIVDMYKYIVNNLKNNVVMNENVLSFITTFSTGTAHGYAGLFYIINEYLKDYEKYKDYKIIVYKNSQNGILDIINYFKNMNVIKNDIIYIDSDIIYKFNKYLIIPNKHHAIDPPYGLEISKMIEKYLIKPNFNIIHKRVAVIKSSLSSNLTNSGIIDINNINNFCSKNNLIFIEPINYNEIDFINILYNCNLFVVSWGTAFFKNYYYISDKCTKIIVLVIGNDFIKQYNDTINANNLITKFKNANMEYIIIDNSNDIDNIIIS